MTHYTIDKPKHGSQDWLNARWRNDEGLARISASVAAAVYDKHNYITGGDLAVELLAERAPEPKEQNAAMDRGNRLEPFIRQWASEMFALPITEPVVMYCYDEPGVRLIATLDGLCDTGPVEIKTTSVRWTGELPEQWYWQGVQQALCANADAVEWIIFDSSLQLYRHTQKVTSDEKRMHIESCREFLADIDAGIIPFGVMVKAEHAAYMHPKSDDTVAFLDSNGAELVDELQRTCKQISQLEKIESELKGRIGLLLGDAAVGLYEDSEIVSWKNQTRKSFDQKRFEQEHPALADKFRKEINIRVMKTKGDKK